LQHPAATDMSNVAHNIILQTEVGAARFGCRGLSGVPAARRGWISLVSSGSDAGRRLAGELASELEAVMIGASPEVRATDIECPANPAEMRPQDYPDRLKLVVLVGSDDRKFTDQSWYETWESDEHQSHVMVVLPPGEYDDYFDAAILAKEKDKHILRRINAATWKESIKDVLPAILARAEITSAVNRVFISYRRLETLPFALQLFDRLVHEGFDVFLDRFSISPGYDFQRRLSQELEDKAMVVLLESKSLRKSKWTQHEIDFAKRNRLGMLSLRMPDVGDDALLASIDFDARESLRVSDFQGPTKSVPEPDGSGAVDQWSELTPSALDRVAAKVKSAHAKALFRRRHTLRADVVAAVNAERGVHATYSATGPITVVCGSDQHLMWLTTRPAEVDDFRSIHLAHLARPGRMPDWRAIIVGPQAALEPDRQKRLQWLRDVSQCLSFDEGNLPDFARRIATRSWS
jgi:hypothetical protein